MGNFTGTSGDDVWTGTDANETADGGAGSDKLAGGGGDDTLDGGDGNDRLTGGAGNDVLIDDFGVDVLDGGSGTDTFYVDLGRGFSTADQIVGGADHDTLYIAGGRHDDWLDLAPFSISGIESLVSLTGSFRMSVEGASSFERVEVWGLELTNGGTLIAGENFKVWDIRLSDAGNNLDLSLAAPLN